MEQLIISTISQSLIFAIAALGVYITFRILDFPDLSVDGTFTLGASISAIMIKNGINPLIAIITSIIGGMIAGSITGILHVKLKITNILSGIIVMIGLYSVNLRVMGKSNIHLFDSQHLFIGKSPNLKLLIIALFVIVLKLLFDKFFTTEKGYILKALGENEEFVTSLGFNTDSYKILGLILANGAVGLSGSLYAQYQGFSDISMGIGLIVSALASIVIGEMILKRFHILPLKISSIVIFGSLMYRIILSAALQLGVDPSDLKLVTALIMIIILSNKSVPKIQSIQLRRTKSDAKHKKAIQNV